MTIDSASCGFSERRPTIRRGTLSSLGYAGLLSISMLLVALYAERSSAQIADGTFDGFQDGTTQGWVVGLSEGYRPSYP